jgi:hypothetical protein
MNVSSNEVKQLAESQLIVVGIDAANMKLIFVMQLHKNCLSYVFQCEKVKDFGNGILWNISKRPVT